MPAPEKGHMKNAANATRFGKHTITFAYDATTDQLVALGEEALANGIKSGICAAVKGKRSAIDDREAASALDIRDRFPSEVRDIKVELVDVGEWTPSVGADPIGKLTAAVKSGRISKADALAALELLDD